MGIALLAAIAGCSAPEIRIERSRPPCIQLGTGAKIGLEATFEDGPGPRKNEGVIGAIVVASGGQFLSKREAAEPVLRELDLKLRRGSNPIVQVAAADIIVRAHPTEWSYQGPTPPLPGRNGSGYLRVRIEVVRANDSPGSSIYSATYWSKVQAPDEMQAMARAADRVAERFADDLRPGRVCNVVEMDDCDPRVETGISLCQCGRFDAAYSAFSDLAVKAPDSAPVLYDLAVLKESRGEYDDAEALLLRATNIEPKGIYYIALERVRAAKRDAEALGSTP